MAKAFFSVEGEVFVELFGGRSLQRKCLRCRYDWSQVDAASPPIHWHVQDAVLGPSYVSGVEDVDRVGPPAEILSAEFYGHLTTFLNRRQIL